MRKTRQRTIKVGSYYAYCTNGAQVSIRVSLTSRVLVSHTFHQITEGDTMNGTGSQILLEDVDVAAQRNESIIALFSFEPEKREEVEQMLLSVNISRHRYVHTFFSEF